SSRRRHTRFSRDWSSDVCSSDLLRKGYYLSLGTAVLSGRLDDLIKEIPLHRVLLETDQQKTEIFEIYAYFCRTRKIPMDRLQAQLMDNFRTVFNYSAVK